MPPTKMNLNTNPIVTRAQLEKSTGLSWDNIFQNPDRVIRKMSVSDEWEFYQDVEADDMVVTCMNKIARGASSLKWEIYQQESEDSLFSLIKNNFDVLGRNGFIRDMLKSIIKTIAYGRQFIEVKWSYIDGFWQVSSLHVLPLELFKYDSDGQVKIKGSDLTQYKEVPEYRLLNPRNNATLRNPYGEALLSKCYWPVFFKKNSLQFMNVFLERDGMPWITAEYDITILKQIYPDKTPEDAITELTNLIKTKVADAILTLPKGIDLKIDNPASSSNAQNYKLLIDIVNESISRIWTGHTATTIATPGKLGDDKTAENEFENVINDAKEIVVETFNQLIMWIAKVNFSSFKELPQFQFYEERDINKELADRDAVLTRDLFVRFSAAYISREYGIAEDEFEIVEPTAGTGVTGPLALNLGEIVAKIEMGLIPDAKALYKEVVRVTGITNQEAVDKIVVQCLEKAI